MRVLDCHAPQEFRIACAPPVLFQLDPTQDDFLRKCDGKYGFGASALFRLPQGVRETVQGVPTWQIAQVRVGRAHCLNYDIERS